MSTMDTARYAQVTQAAAATLGGRELYGLTVVASTSGTVTIYDNTSAAGTILFTKGSLAVGDVVHFGGRAIRAGTGLHVVCGGTATVNVLYR